MDQNIDADSGYEVISEKGHHLNRARAQNIPVTYLVPIGEKFVLKVEDDNGPCRNKKFSLDTDNGSIEGKTDANGILEISLQEGFGQGEISLWLDDSIDEPTQKVPFRSEAEALSDVSTVEGQQLRLNNLGFNAGVVDGLMGRKTKAAAKCFQSNNRLDVDGIIGPKTQKQLKKVYGQ